MTKDKITFSNHIQHIQLMCGHRFIIYCAVCCYYLNEISL